MSKPAIHNESQAPLADPRQRPAPRRSFRPPSPLVRIAFAFFVASIPFEGLTFGTMTLSRLVGLAFFAIALLQPNVCFRLPPKGFWPFAVFVVLFSVRSWLGSHGDPLELRYRILLFIQLLVVLWAASNLLRYPRMFLEALVMFVMSCVLLSILQFRGVTSEAVGDRESAFNLDPNGVGCVLALGVVAVVAIGYGRKSRGWAFKVVTWLCFGVIGVEIVRTGSRGALVGLAAGIGMLVVRSGSAWSRFRGVLIVAAGLGALLLLISTSELSRKRWELTLEKGSLAGRERIFPVALGMFLQKPVFGWGFGVNDVELGKRLGMMPRDTHNTYLWVLTEDGLLGALPYFVGLAFCVRAAWRARRGVYGLVPLALLSEVLVTSMSLNWQYRKLHWLILGFALAGESPLRAVRKLRPPSVSRRLHSLASGSSVRRVAEQHRG